MLEIIGGIATAVIAGIILHLVSRIRDPIRVRRITSEGDPLVTQTFELYQSLFPEDDGTNYSVDELMECMDIHPPSVRHVFVTNIALAATFKGSVVGFVFAHFYPERRKAIISYFAIDKTIKEARVDGIAAKKLLKELKTTLLKEVNCDALFYDIERVSPSMPIEERRRKMGRAGIFRTHAKTLKLQAQEFQFQYQCPKVSLSEFAHEQPFSLFCVGISAPIPKELPKQQILDYLRFVYLDCYGDVYPKDDPRFAAHQEHLQKMIRHYEEILP